jgi:hypothetical protein
MLLANMLKGYENWVESYSLNVFLHKTGALNLMSVHQHPIRPVLEETARVAHLAFPKGNRYMIMRDEIGTL